MPISTRHGGGLRLDDSEAECGTEIAEHGHRHVARHCRGSTASTEARQVAEPLLEVAAFVRYSRSRCLQ
jgi:hypothetical protein